MLEQEGPRFILINTSHPGNVGACARALKVMGFADLVLVAPRDAKVLRRHETQALASGALDVLAGARVVDTLTDALEGIDFVCATAMTPRDFGPPTYAPRALFEALVHDGPRRVALAFGSERYGMRNEDVYRCHACVSIPTHPAYGSLNLAQAVQLLAYDWRLALGGFAAKSAIPAQAQLADAQALAGVLEHWEKALVALGFLDPAAPRKLMPRLNQILNRAQLTTQEVHILRGMARAILKTKI